MATVLLEKLKVKLGSNHSLRASNMIQDKLQLPMRATNSAIGIVHVLSQSRDLPIRSWHDHAPHFCLKPPQAPRMKTSKAASPKLNTLSLQSTASIGSLALVKLKPFSFSIYRNSFNHFAHEYKVRNWSIVAERVRVKVQFFQ